VTAERRVLGRMLEAQEAAGVTHALVSDSFFMESAAVALPAWSPPDRARLYNDALAALIARYPGRLFGLGCVDPFSGEAAARELERMVDELGFLGALVNPTDVPTGGCPAISTIRPATRSSPPRRSGAGRSSSTPRVSCPPAATSTTSCSR